jgi:hypothetical protein
VDAAREIAKLAEAGIELLPRPLQRRSCPVGDILQLSVKQRQFHPGGHESLLCAVVEIALDAPSCLVGGLDEAGA